MCPSDEGPLWAGSVGARRGSSTTTCRASVRRLLTLALLSEWDGAEVVQPPVFKLNDLQGPDGSQEREVSEGRCL